MEFAPRGCLGARPAVASARRGDRDRSPAPSRRPLRSAATVPQRLEEARYWGRDAHPDLATTLPRQHAFSSNVWLLACDEGGTSSTLQQVQARLQFTPPDLCDEVVA